MDTSEATTTTTAETPASQQAATFNPDDVLGGSDGTVIDAIVDGLNHVSADDSDDGESADTSSSDEKPAKAKTKSDEAEDTSPSGNEGGDDDEAFIRVPKADWAKKMEALDKYYAMQQGQQAAEAQPKVDTAQTGQAKTPQTTDQATPRLAPLTDEQYYKMMDSREAFEAYQAQHDTAVVQACVDEFTKFTPEIVSNTIAQQFPFFSASWDIQRQCPEYRSYPNVVLQSIKDVLAETPDLAQKPAEWIEKAIQHLRGTAMLANNVAEKKVHDARPARRAQFAPKPSSSKPRGGDRRDPTVSAFAEIAKFEEGRDEFPEI